MKPRQQSAKQPTPKERVLSALVHGPRSKKSIAKDTGVNGYLSEVLRALKRDGMIKNPARGVWELTSPLPAPLPKPVLEVVPMIAPSAAQPAKRQLASPRLSNTERVLEALKESDTTLTPSELCERADVPSTSIHNALAKLRTTGQVERIGRARSAKYRIAANAPTKLKPSRGSLGLIDWQDKLRFLANWEGITVDAFVDKLLTSYKRKSR